MERYADFWTLTQEALEFAFQRYPAVPHVLRQPLLDAYQRLDAYPDVVPALRSLAAAGKRLAVFTNGTRAMARAAATSAGIASAFEAIVSVEIRQFKTDPEAYGLVHETMGLALGKVALVSSNRWDVAGATAFGISGDLGEPHRPAGRISRPCAGSRAAVADRTGVTQAAGGAAAVPASLAAWPVRRPPTSSATM